MDALPLPLQAAAASSFPFDVACHLRGLDGGSAKADTRALLVNKN